MQLQQPRTHYGEDIHENFVIWQFCHLFMDLFFAPLSVHVFLQLWL